MAVAVLVSSACDRVEAVEIMIVSKIDTVMNFPLPACPPTELSAQSLRRRKLNQSITPPLQTGPQLLLGYE